MDFKSIVEMWKDEQLAFRDFKIEEFSEAKLLYFGLSTMKALSYLHSNNFYYGDMKPSNILIFQNMQVKLGDFGTAEKFDGMSSNLYLRGAT